MNNLAAAIEKNISERKLFRDGMRILVAVSGGLDSMVLLALLDSLADRRRWKLTVAHFNHQLRGPESKADEKLVRQAAKKLGLSFVTAAEPVGEFAQKEGLSLEMAARKLRHDFLARSAAALKIPVIALAHHADDQVELFFLRLLRGAGGEGLAGMKWSNRSPGNPRVRLTRPLLNQTKMALRDFSLQNKILFSEDASNASIDIRRNRIRHELIPLLTRNYQPALNDVVLRAMEVLGAETEFVMETAQKWIKEALPDLFDDLPVAVQRSGLQQQLLASKVSPSFDLVERLRTNPCQAFSIDAEHSVSRDPEGKVHLIRLNPVQFCARKRLVQFSGTRGWVEFGGLEVDWQLAREPGRTIDCPRPDTEYFDAEKVGPKIWLRCWQPGDRFQPIGMRSSQKLQDLFTNLKVDPVQRRERVVAVTGQDELFWVEGLRMAEKFKLGANTIRRLRWRWERKPG